MPISGTISGLQILFKDFVMSWMIMPEIKNFIMEPNYQKVVGACTMSVIYTYI